MRYRVKLYNNYKFEWDENKNKNNIRKHKVSFYEAITIFESPFLPLTKDDDLHSQYEQRDKTIGLSAKNRLLTVINTDRENVIRIISARKANPLETKNYYEYFSEYIPFG